ncbi:MAG: CDP-alcohol phosphatidyltransferase family protein [Desulfurococcaceae archaeon]|jgi:archaetidylinositol phosphate synthase|nr:CDP-alcohol phosphatidyltransferase family protein [Desulfurococcaceae archaeon]MCC6058407.1 CDP-alcohol phosphatidyltransferase family protein [Desulfurococcaceae archaeon]
MITRLRRAVSRYFEALGVKLYRLGITPNTVTFAGLFFSMLCPIAVLFKEPVIAVLLMVISSFADAIDGALARVSGFVSRFGSVVDSFSDRVSEFMFLYSLFLLGIRADLILIALLVSFLISYLRALGEKQGLYVEGIGLLERGERLILIFIAFLGVVMNFNIVTYATLILLIVLGLITVIQRLIYLEKKLR